MDFARQMGHDPDRIRALFIQFKAAYTFETQKEAEEAMARFLRLLTSEPRYRDSRFLHMMERQCHEALEDAKSSADAFLEREELETLEWNIDPSGVALEHRAYDLTGTDELTVMASPRHRFPADYAVRVLGCSADRDTIDLDTFRRETGLSAEESFYIIKNWPQQAYSGSSTALRRVRISEGAMYYQIEYGAPAGAYRPRWPDMRVTKMDVHLF